MPDNFKIRTMSRKDLDLAVDWAANEGWNPGLYDAESFYAADPLGFFIGELNGEPVSTVSAVRYGKTFGFLGFYIVKPEYRGKNYGILTGKAGFEYLSGRNIGLDGVVAQQDNYRKSGFKIAHRNMRYEGVTGGNMPNKDSIIRLTEIPFDVTENYDRRFFPDQRTDFLKAWLCQPESLALGILDKGKLTGYGMIRVCRSGYKIGPLFADNAKLAETLFLALKAGVKSGEPVCLDIPELNSDALALVNKYSMNFIFETARMYTGPAPNLPMDRLFGITSFELG